MTLAGLRFSGEKEGPRTDSKTFVKLGIFLCVVCGALSLVRALTFRQKSLYFIFSKLREKSAFRLANLIPKTSQLFF